MAAENKGENSLLNWLTSEGLEDVYKNFINVGLNDADSLILCDEDDIKNLSKQFEWPLAKKIKFLRAFQNLKANGYKFKIDDVSNPESKLIIIDVEERKIIIENTKILEDIKSSYEIIEQEIQNLDINGKKCKHEVETTFENMIKALEKRKKSLILNIEKLQNDKKKKLLYQLEELLSASYAMEKNQEKCINEIQKSIVIKDLDIRRQQIVNIGNKIKSLYNNCKKNPQTNSKILFDKYDKILLKINQYGNISEEKENQLTPQEEKKLIKSIGNKPKISGETWYPISKQWYQSWMDYVSFDNVDSSTEYLSVKKVKRPGPIDNSDLQDFEHPLQLKENLFEGMTHVWVHEDVWDLLFKWYKGEPSFPRKVSISDLELYPIFLQIVYANRDGKPTKKRQFKSYPPHETLRNILKDISTSMKDENGNSPEISLHIRFKNIKSMYIRSNSRLSLTEQDIKNENQERWIEIPDDNLDVSLEANGFKDGVELLIVKKNCDGKWPRTRYGEDWKIFRIGDILDVKDNQQKWYESVVCGVQNGNICVHYIGWETKWDEWIRISLNLDVRLAKRGSYTKGPHRSIKVNI